MAAASETSPATWALTDITAALDTGRLSAAALVTAVLERLYATEPQIHAYLRHDGDAALAQAAEADRRAAQGARRGPLDGVPFGVKDTIYTARLPTTAGSAVPQDYDPTLNATLVARLEAQGAILLGKCNTWEYGTGSGHVRFDLPAPPARNPWNPAHYTGGSSSGSAAAVAAGSACFTLGTDSGGSVRLPAAGCGVVGFKPTFGGLSRAGILPNTWSFDTPGPICATVADAALVHDAIAGHDPGCDVSLTAAPPCLAAQPGRSIAGLRVGRITNLDGPEGPPDPAILAALDHAAQAFAALGALVQDLHMPVAPSQFRAVAAPINWAESFALHERDFLTQRHRMGQALRDKLETGMYLRAVDYLAATRERRRLVAQVDALFGQVDLLLLPMTYRPAPRITETDAVQSFTTGSAGSAFSLTGHPALSLPAGLTDTAQGGVPVAVQLAAGFRQDAVLIRAAHALEQEFAARGIHTPRRAPCAGMAPAAQDRERSAP